MRARACVCMYIYRCVHVCVSRYVRVYDRDITIQPQFKLQHRLTSPSTSIQLLETAHFFGLPTYLFCLSLDRWPACQEASQPIYTHIYKPRYILHLHAVDGDVPVATVNKTWKHGTEAWHESQQSIKIRYTHYGCTRGETRL